MNPISFFAQGIPKGQPRPRAFARKIGDKFFARVYDAGTAEHWKSCVAEAARPFADMMLNEPCSVTINFILPRPKAHFNSKGILKLDSPIWHTKSPDGDNLYKGTVDALVKLGVFSDDSIICHHEVRKLYGVRSKNGAVITIENPSKYV